MKVILNTSLIKKFKIHTKYNISILIQKSTKLAIHLGQ